VTTWREAEPADTVRIGPPGLVLAVLRGLVFGAVTYGGLALLLLLRLIERPLFGADRPLTPHVTRTVCRLAFPILGIRYRVRGTPMRHRGAVVSNHVSWLDIFALNACQTVYFVAKSEVSRWAFIGWLARATGTVFIARDPKEAKAQQAVFEARLRAGHKLMFFPEGTSTDGLRVIPFKSTLFAAFYTHGLDEIMQVQPVSLVYRAPDGRGERFYGWWGDMNFASHLLKVLAQFRQGSVEVVFHDPIAVDSVASRKDLARACEASVRSDLRTTLGPRYRG
jgi:1-acyl-sn-glycerol-3-phosphate acyltransferase